MLRIPLRRRRWGGLVAVVVSAAALTVPIAWASDWFDDVPDSNPHHFDIGAIAGVGITTGCNPPTNNLYCPTDAVSRQQMASFLRRGLGRVGTAGTLQLGLTETFQDVAVTTITAGGAPGGFGNVLVHGELTAREPFPASLVAPQQVEYRLRYEEENVNSSASRVTVWPTPSGTAYGAASASMSRVFVVDTGIAGTFKLQARIATGTEQLNAEFTNIAVLYVPFGAQGF